MCQLCWPTDAGWQLIMAAAAADGGDRLRMETRMMMKLWKRKRRLWRATRHHSTRTTVLSTSIKSSSRCLRVSKLHLCSCYRVPTHPWKYLNFFLPKFKALKVLEKRTGAWKSLNFITRVLESPWIHHDVKHCDHQIH